MPKNELTKNINKLIHVDIDSVFAYEQIIESIGVSDIEEDLKSFREDHRRHVSELSSILKRIGADVPDFSRDVKGFIISGLTSIRGAMGPEGALKAMRGNERMTNRIYEEALSWDLPEEVRITIERARADEFRHLQSIERAIEKRLWEKSDEESPLTDELRP